MSGDSQENVEKAIGNVRGLGLAASNGACFAPPLKDGEVQRRWKFFDLGVDWEAVKAVSSAASILHSTSLSSTTLCF